MNRSLLEIKNLKFNYNNQNEVLKNLHFSIDKGEVISLLGPSGTGKTTLLRLIAGFEKVQQGSIHYAGRIIDQHHFIPPHLRQIGIVFQEGTLFPHLKVKENILFPIQSWTKKEKKLRLEELLNLFSINGIQNQYPFQLSGGEEKRVAVARALAFSPQLLLMDEPFTHLDMSLKEELLLELRECFKKTNTSVLFVTHNRKEAFTFSDQMGVLESGVIHQKGTAQELYQKPKTAFVFKCLGEGSALPITIHEHQMQSEIGCLNLKTMNRYYLNKLKHKTKAWLYIRPEEVILDETSPFHAQIEQSQYLGSFYQVKLRLPSGGFITTFFKPRGLQLKTGTRVGIRLKIKEPIAFENEEI